MNVHSGPAMSEMRVSLICALLASLGPVALAIYIPALPAIATELGVSVAEAQLTVSLFFAGFAAAQLVCGALSDVVGRKPVLYGFVVLFVMGSIAAALAESISIMIAARFAQGLGVSAGVALSRAIVRDLFNGPEGARVQSGVSIALAIGPAIAPYIGGLMLSFAHWRAIFWLLAAVGLATLVVIAALLRETVRYDLARAAPAKILLSYRHVLSQREFILPSLVIAGTSGTVYAQAAILPFVMIEQIGLTPGQFGLSMLMQPFMFFLGSMVVRARLAVTTDRALSGFGLIFIALCAFSYPVIHGLVAPNFWTVMLPVALWGWGVAFILPVMTTVALESFPFNSGAAAAVLGFLQMGAGLVGGLAAALFIVPSTALFVLTPSMAAVALVSWCLWARKRRAIAQS